MGGNEYYVKERPNPDGLTHREIFQRLVEDGTGVSGGGPTEPLLTNGERLYDALLELAQMVKALRVSYQAESARLATQAIENVGQHVDHLAVQASQIANGFNGYIEAYQEARTRVPPLVPFGDLFDAADTHTPGLLAHIPILAQLEAEHDARTREAREVYRRLDQAAVAADAATPEFPLMFEPVTNDQDAVETFGSTTTGTRWPGTASSVSASGSGGPTGPAAAGPASPTLPVSPSPVVGGPVAPTPGAGAGGGSVVLPLPTSPGSPGVGSGAGAGGVSPGVTGGPWGRVGLGADGSQARGGNRAWAGGADDAGRGIGTGGGRTGGLGLSAGEAGAARAAGGLGGRGASGAVGSGFGPLGAGGRKDEDREHVRASFLEADESADTLFGTDQKVAPPVIGETAPKQYDS